MASRRSAAVVPSGCGDRVTQSFFVTLKCGLVTPPTLGPSGETGTSESKAGTTFVSHTLSSRPRFDWCPASAAGVVLLTHCVPT